MSHPMDTRYPFENLERKVAIHVLGRGATLQAFFPNTLLQVYQRSRLSGFVPELAADRIASHMQMHPSEIWPQWTIEVWGGGDVRSN